MPNLHEGETYQFRVRAVNAAGEGKPSKQTEPVTCRPHVSKCISSLHAGLRSLKQWIFCYIERKLEIEHEKDFCTSAAMRDKLFVLHLSVRRVQRTQ